MMGAVQILHEQCARDQSRDLHGVVLERFLVAAKERNQGLQWPVRSFGHFIRGLPMRIRSSTDRPAAWAGSLTGRCHPAVIELRL
jgi:hypothetical protein